MNALLHALAALDADRKPADHRKPTPDIWVRERPECELCGKRATHAVYEYGREVLICSDCDDDGLSALDRMSLEAGVPRYGEI